MNGEIRVDQIDNIDHYSYLVRGTDDQQTALNAVRTFLMSDMGQTSDEVNQWHPKSEHRGWFRWNPCSPVSCYDGGGHPMHLARAKGPGRGNWQAIEYDSDES